MLEAVLMVALGIPASENPRFDELLASGDLAPLERSGEVRATRVDNFLGARMEPPADVESLGLPGVFRLRPGARPVAPEDAAVVRTLLRSAASYESSLTLCTFEPGVAFSFPTRAELLVLVCFKCEEVAFVRGSERLAKFRLSETGKRGLLTLSSRLYPDLGKRSEP